MTQQPQQQQQQVQDAGKPTNTIGGKGAAYATKIIAKYKKAQQAHDYFLKSYGSDVLRAGVSSSPRAAAIRTMFLCILVAGPAGIVGCAILAATGIIGAWSPLLILAAPLPCCMLFVIRLYSLRDRISKRASGVDRELFFFSIYCDIIEQTGRGLYGAFMLLLEQQPDEDEANDPATKNNSRNNKKVTDNKAVRKRKINFGKRAPKNKTAARTSVSTPPKEKKSAELFPSMFAEARVIRRNILVFSKSFLDILYDTGVKHPSAEFRDFLRGYAVTQTTGGTSTKQFLHEKLREYQVAEKLRMDSYASKSEMLATVGSFGLVMFPIFITIGGIMIPPATLLLMCGAGLVGIPFAIMILAKIANGMSPVKAGEQKVQKVPIILAGATGAVGALFVLLLSGVFAVWEVVSVVIIVWAFSNFVMARGQLGEMERLERSVPAFVRDITQKMKSDPSFFSAFKSVEQVEGYTPEFNSVLHQIKSKVNVGVNISEALATSKTGSWLADCVLRLLSYAVRTGSVTPVVLEKLAMFGSHHQETRKQIAAQTATPLMTGYMGAIIVVMMLQMIPVSSFEDFAGGFDHIIQGETIDVTGADEGQQQLLTELNLVLVVVVAACSMFLVSQIRYATVLHSLHTGILTIVVMIVLEYGKYTAAGGAVMPFG